MKITSRLIKGCGFIDIKVDAIETTIFVNSTKEIDDMIYDLERIIEDLEELKALKKK